MKELKATVSQKYRDNWVYLDVLRIYTVTVMDHFRAQKKTQSLAHFPNNIHQFLKEAV